MSIYVSKYKGVLDTNGEKVLLRDVISSIQDGTYEDIITRYREEKNLLKKEEIKKQIDAVTFSGTFSRREDDKILSYSQYLCIDFDNVGKRIMPRFKAYVNSMPFVAASFVSPSYGLKALVKVSIKDPKYHRDYAYPQIVKSFDKVGRQVKIDPKCKNLSRLCFLSHDPDVYIAKKPSVFIVQTKNYHPYGEYNQKPIESSYIEYSVRNIFATALKFADKNVGPYKRGNRNNYIHHVACIMNRAGVSQRDAENAIFNKYKMRKEFVNAIKSAYVNNKSEHGSRPIVVTNKKNTNSLL